MSLFAKLAMLARSPQGRRMTRQAMRYAQSPEGRRKIAAARQKVAARGTKRVR